MDEITSDTEYHAWLATLTEHERCIVYKAAHYYTTLQCQNMLVIARDFNNILDERDNQIASLLHVIKVILDEHEPRLQALERRT